MFFAKKKDERIDIDKELGAIMTFLEEAGDDVNKLLGLCKEMKKFRDRDKEAVKRKLPDIGLGFNTTEEIKVWDKFLPLYDFFDEDVQINKQRVKMVAAELRMLAKERKVDPKLVQKIESSVSWKFNW